MYVPSAYHANHYCTGVIPMKFKKKTTDKEIQILFGREVIFSCPLTHEGVITMEDDKSFYIDYASPHNNMKMRDVYSISNGHVLVETMMKVPFQREIFDTSWMQLSARVLC